MSNTQNQQLGGDLSDLMKGLDLNLGVTANPSKPMTQTTQSMVQNADVVHKSDANDMLADSSKRISLLDGKTVPEIKVMAQEAAKKLNQIRRELSIEFFERDEVILDLMRAVTVGEHVLLLGPPGTAKSLLIRAFNSRVTSAKLFQWLLNRTSDPSEILGPFSIKAMERDEFRRQYANKLPDCHFAFVDEIFKANEPVLNILLPVLNERIFFNGTTPIQIPLVTMFSASNEMPDDEEELGALFDRLLIRVWVDYIKEASNKKAMHAMYAAKRNGTYAGNQNPTTVTLQELEALRYSAALLDIPDGVINAFNSLLMDLEKQHQIRVSDRRQNACLKVIQANAMLHGRQRCSTDDLSALVSVLWERKEDIDKILSLISKYASPQDQKLSEFKTKFKSIKDTVDAKSGNERSKAVVEATSKLGTLSNAISKAMKELSDQGKDVDAFVTLNTEVQQYNQRMISETMGV